jgi:hypothetical protein
VTGTKGSFTVPTDWKRTKSGDFNVATSTDDKNRFATASYEGDAKPKLDGAAAALGYSDCKWGSDESVSMGKDKIAATVADGVCKRSGNTVHAVRATIAGDDNIVAVGGWDEDGGKDKVVFNTFRSVKLASGDGSGIAACCAAIRGNMQSAPPQQKPAYLAALGACNAAMGSAQGRQALAGVRAALAGVGVPGACQ